MKRIFIILCLVIIHLHADWKSKLFEYTIKPLIKKTKIFQKKIKINKSVNTRLKKVTRIDIDRLKNMGLEVPEKIIQKVDGEKIFLDTILENSNYITKKYQNQPIDFYKLIYNNVTLYDEIAIRLVNENPKLYFEKILKSHKIYNHQDIFFNTLRDKYLNILLNELNMIKKELSNNLSSIDQNSIQKQLNKINKTSIFEYVFDGNTMLINIKLGKFNINVDVISILATVGIVKYDEYKKDFDILLDNIIQDVKNKFNKFKKEYSFYFK